MELNQEFVRSLLLFVESNDDLKGPSEKELEDFTVKEGHSRDNLVYTIHRLLEAGFIKGDVKYASNKPMWLFISAITYDGHKFLDNIRDPKIWKATKKTSSKIASVSLDILSTISADIIQKVIGGQMTL